MEQARGREGRGRAGTRHGGREAGVSLTPWLLFLLGLGLTWALPRYGLINPYHEQVLMYVGINIMLTVSLNLVNGYMGEFSVGHAAFMAVGAYLASFLTVRVFPTGGGTYLFPVALIAGGLGAALVGLGAAVPAFRTRGDYLAIVTLALNMIVKSALENIPALGGPRGFLGMARLTSLSWVYLWTVLTVWLVRNLVYSHYGRGIVAIREDEVAAGLVGVNTRQAKVFAFTVSSFFAGVAGGLFAHLLLFINPRSFDILKSTEILVMVYLGGIGSLAGSILGASLFTLLLEALRSLLAALAAPPVWRWVFAPLLLVVLMLVRPTGLLGLRELPWLVPRHLREGGGGAP